LHEHGIVAEFLIQLISDFVGISSDPITLVDKSNGWDFVPLQLPVDSYRLGLDTTHRTENQDTTIQHTQ
jgi:hypothetical protein